MHILAESLSTGSMVFLVLAIGMALSFEFVNGFHDTANAVATVIYTHTLRPWVAVIWSGCWNLIGVLTSSGAVAFTVLSLLPVDLVINVGSGAGFAMVFALLISAILWNLGTWYLGLPASSSHTLIGSILGVGLANAVMNGRPFLDGVNWHETGKVFKTLLISPAVGFAGAALLLLACKALIKIPALYKAPPANQPPPFFIRCILFLTCTGVSFGHGSNDGQKGMGLLLLILIGILPASYAINLGMTQGELAKLRGAGSSAQSAFVSHAEGNILKPDEAAAEVSAFVKDPTKVTGRTYAGMSVLNQQILDALASHATLAELSVDQRKALRSDAFVFGEAMSKMSKQKLLKADAEQKAVGSYQKELDRMTHHIPSWVKFAIALSLGLGTMIGWKRIVTTVGEKIGKEHLTYAQGASAELVAMTTIFAADYFGLPVSTTHVLSSGVAGTMAANHSGLQLGTLRNLLMAWVLTLPVCVFLGAATFAAGLFIVINHLVMYLAWVALLAAVLAAVLIVRRLAASRHDPVMEAVGAK